MPSLFLSAVKRAEVLITSSPDKTFASFSLCQGFMSSLLKGDWCDKQAKGYWPLV